VHLGNARWAGKVEVKTVIFMCKKGDFVIFLKILTGLSHRGGNKERVIFL